VTKEIRRKKYLNPIVVLKKKKGSELENLRDEAESERKKRVAVMVD